MASDPKGGILALAIGKMRKDKGMPDEPDEPEGPSSGAQEDPADGQMAGLHAASEDLINAIHAKDPAGVADALTNFYDTYDAGGSSSDAPEESDEPTGAYEGD